MLKGYGLAHSRTSNPRAVAAQLLDKMNSKKPLSILLDEGLSGIEPRDAALVKEFCFGVTRWWYQLDALGKQLLRRPIRPKDNDIRLLIMIGLYQLLHMRVAPHAALAETVEASRALRKPWATGLINAVLRRFQREKAELLAAVDSEDSARYLFPPWLAGKLKKAWPNDWISVVQASMEHPPLSLRVNLRRTNRADYMRRLTDEEISAREILYTKTGLELDVPRPVNELPGFDEGLVSVQDGGAQLAAELMRLEPGSRVLDACAAPGGKMCHLLEAAPEGVRLTAVDVDSRRLQRIDQNLARLGLSAAAHLGDASHPGGEWALQRYDRILLDVPCSATGIIRRHPDIKILRQPGQIPELVETQAKILDAIWPLLDRGGLLLYATCSLLPQENQLQVRRFLECQQDARELVIDASWGHACSLGRQTLPGDSNMDGFYYALLQKR